MPPRKGERDGETGGLLAARTAGATTSAPPLRRDERDTDHAEPRARLTDRTWARLAWHGCLHDSTLGDVHLLSLLGSRTITLPLLRMTDAQTRVATMAITRPCLTTAYTTCSPSRRVGIAACDAWSPRGRACIRAVADRRPSCRMHGSSTPRDELAPTDASTPLALTSRLAPSSCCSSSCSSSSTPAS